MSPSWRADCGARWHLLPRGSVSRRRSLTTEKEQLKASAGDRLCRQGTRGRRKSMHLENGQQSFFRFWCQLVIGVRPR
jgi:hypothetical protein